MYSDYAPYKYRGAKFAGTGKAWLLINEKKEDRHGIRGK